MTPEDHSGGPVRCEQLGAFVDGELPAEEAAAFRRHLLVCARCQQEMHGLMQLSALAEQAREERPTVRPGLAPMSLVAQERRARPRRAAWVGVVGAVAMAAALVLAIRGRSSGPELPTLLASFDQRTVSGWPSRLGPREYRRYEVSRGVNGPRKDSLARAELQLLAAERWDELATLAILRRDFDAAEGYLARLPESPGVLNDRGLILLERSRCDDALELFGRALAKAPDFPPALFNRGRCMRELGLPFAATQAFAAVKAANLGGWSKEAAEMESDLERQTTDYRTFIDQWRAAARAYLDAGTPLPEPLVRRAPSLARNLFYVSLATSPDRESARSRLVAARELDSELRIQTLERRAQWSLRQPFRPGRAEVAARLKRWLLRLETPTPSDVDRLLEEARRLGERDLLLHALENFRKFQPTDERARLAAETGDDWSLVQLDLARAYQVRGKGSLEEAERILRRARSRCTDPSMGIPCAYLSQQLAEVYQDSGRIQDALREYTAGARQARETNLAEYERNSLVLATDLRAQADRLASAASTYEELKLREPEHCDLAAWSLEQLAQGYLRRGDVQSARDALARRPACTRAPEPWRAQLELQVALVGGDRPALEAATASADRLAKTAELERDRLLYAYVAASGRLELGQPGAEPVLQDLVQADRLAAERDVASARASALEQLALVEVRSGRPAQALENLARLSRTTPADRCVVGWVDHLGRTGWALRGAGGETRAQEGGGKTELRLPAEALAALRGCGVVEVYATSDVQGREALLPDDMAWSFRAGGTGVEGRAAGRGPKLLVRNPRAPAELNLPQLGFRERRDLAGWEVLEGSSATPSRVQEALRSASVVDFEVHGWIDAEVPDGALLVLSEDTDRRYALSAATVSELRLEGSPVVMLGACHAAAGSRFREQPWSLPQSFVRAGARAVYASRSELPDAEVGEFFAGLERRLESGESPAVALRNERVRWLQDGRGWVRDVVVFN